MPLKTDLISTAEDIANETIHGLFQLVDDEIDARREHPAWWAVFHREMARMLPKWRRLAKAWHRMMYRRMRAMCAANAIAHCKLECNADG